MQTTVSPPGRSLRRLALLICVIVFPVSAHSGFEPGPRDNPPGTCTTLKCPFKAVQVSVGSTHVCALLENGFVKCWGDNTYGQLGQEDAITRGDDPDEMGSHLLPIDLGSISPVKQLASGSEHTCALFEDSTVKCWGRNNVGQLGLGDTVSRGLNRNDMGVNLLPVNLGTNNSIQQIVAGAYHTCVLFEDGEIKCWGQNDDGQLGLGDYVDRGSSPADMGTNLPTVDLQGSHLAIQIDAGYKHSCAILDSGKSVCWGDNLTGELGQAQGYYSYLINSPAGLDHIKLGFGRTAIQIAAGGIHTCAILDTDKLKCWGSNGLGELGVGDTLNRGRSTADMGSALPAVSLSSISVPTTIALGAYYTCAVLADGKLKCWGDGAYGELGQEDTRTRGDNALEMGIYLPYVQLGSGRSVEAVSLNKSLGYPDGNQACAILDNGRIKCWGSNDRGQLGVGDTLSRGSIPGEMGDALPYVDLGS